MTSLPVHLVALAMISAGAACSGDDPQDASAARGGDAGHGGAHSESPAEAGSVPPTDSVPGTRCSGELPVMSVLDVEHSVELEPDWTCYDGPPPDEPAPARQGSLSLAKSVPALVDSVEGLKADVFFGPSTVGAPSATFTFGASGIVELSLPAGVGNVSLHVHKLSRPDPRYDIAELREYDVPVPATGVIEASSALTAMHRLATNLVQASDPEAPHTALLMAEARDCQGRDVGGARFTLLDADSGEAVPTSSMGDLPRPAYSQFALPNPECTFTTVGRAEWMLANAPVNVSGDSITRRYKLRLEGRMREKDVEPRVLGEREVELFAGTTSIVRLYRVSAECEVISGSIERCR